MLHWTVRSEKKSSDHRGMDKGYRTQFSYSSTVCVRLCFTSDNLRSSPQFLNAFKWLISLFLLFSEYWKFRSLGALWNIKICWTIVSNEISFGTYSHTRRLNVHTVLILNCFTKLYCRQASKQRNSHIQLKSYNKKHSFPHTPVNLKCLW